MKKKIVILPVLLIVLFIQLTQAQENPAFAKSDSSGYSWDRFSVNIGAFLTGLNNDLSIASQQVGLGVNINLEDALGLKRTSMVFRGDLEYNYGKRRRHSLRIGYFGMFRDAYKVLEADLEIGDVVYPAGTEINSSFDFQIFRALYDYSFYLDERIRLGFSIGLYIMPMSFSIESSYSVNESAAFVAPLPVLGFRTAFRITPKLMLKQNIEVLYLSFSDFRGSIVDSNFGLEYQLWKHFGLGLGYNAFRYSVAAYDENTPLGSFKGTATSSFTGLLLYGVYSF